MVPRQGITYSPLHVKKDLSLSLLSLPSWERERRRGKERGGKNNTHQQKQPWILICTTDISKENKVR